MDKLHTTGMRCLILASVAGVAGGISAQNSKSKFQAQRNSDRPNIVLILSEDLSPRFGCYGDKVARTPNIDALAKEGVIFTNVYTMAGVSSPSRAGLITGVMPNFTGTQHMRSGTFPGGAYASVPPAHIKAYPEILRKNGYFTYGDVKFDYQFVNSVPDPGPFTIWDEHGNYGNIEDQLLRPVWREFDLKGKPFFLNYNPQITHESGLFDVEILPKGMQKNSQMWFDLRDRYKPVPTNPNNVVLDPYWADTPETRKEVARFYDNIQVMDMQVGDVIKNLKEDGLWDNTIIIVSTDHGDCLPRHKRDNYASSTQVPLIVRIPKKYRPQWLQKTNVKDNRLISFEDLTPTILGFANIEKPSYMQGVNLSDDKPAERKYVYGSRGRQGEVQDFRLYTVLGSDGFQYIRNLDLTPNGAQIAYRNFSKTQADLNKGFQDGTLNADQQKWFKGKDMEELYDLKKDPFQLNNIAKDPKYIKILKTYREELDRWRSSENDMNIIPESIMHKDLLDENGKQRVTLPPVAVQDEINKKIYISTRTEGASIGYSFDGKKWELYTGSFDVPEGIENVMIKAIRYGWKESEVNTINVK